jgi:hypothetical protein
MAKRIDFLNQPYRPILTIPKEKIESLFMKMNIMDTQEIKQFSMVNNVPLNVDDTNGENLIHKAINIENILKKEFHRLNIIKFLVQNDVNPDKPNKENQTPLHMACKYQYADIVKYLISLDVNVNYQDNYGATPFHYALQGQIKLMDPDRTLQNFIPSQKKVDTKRKEKLLEIKKDLWELIKDENFIKSIKNTIDSSIYSDKKIETDALKLYDKISKKITDPEPVNYLKSIKEEIDPFKKSIKELIEKKWNKFSESNDISIHEKKRTSYDFTDNKFSTLKNINIKDIIVKNINKSKEDIKINCKEIYESVENDSLEKTNDKLKKDNLSIVYNIYNAYYKKFRDDFLEIQPPPPAPPAPPAPLTATINKLYDDSLEKKWTKFTKAYLHENAVDFADNIIDWQKLTFMGGSREMAITCFFIDIQAILKIRDIKQKVFYILAGLTYVNIDHNGNLFFGLTIFNEANIIAFITSLALNEAQKLAIIMVYNKIFDNKLDEYLPPWQLAPPVIVRIPPQPPQLSYISNQDLFNKWSELLNNKDKVSAIYVIMCQSYCSTSNDNLTGTMSCMIPMLASALKVSEQTLDNDALDNAIKTCMKKYFIEEYMNDPDVSKTTINKVFASINILLDEGLNNTNNYYYNLNLNPEINNKFNELQNILNVNPINEESRNNKFFELNSLITKKINKMKNKPLKQDIVSLLTYISNSCFNNDVNCVRVYPKINNFIQPPPLIVPSNSYEPNMLAIIKNYNNMYIISYLNLLVDYDLIYFLNIVIPHIEANTSRLSLRKFKESKHLGLYYQGLIQIPYNINQLSFEDPHPQDLTVQRVPNNTTIQISIIQSHFIIINNLKNDLTAGFQLPLIGNYLINGIHNFDYINNSDLKYYKYVDYKYRPPIYDDTNSLDNNTKKYFDAKIKKLLSIILYSPISEDNLFTIINSKKKLSKAFTDIYVFLYFIHDMLNDDDDTKNKIKEIITSLNDYNANLLLYSYLFSTGNYKLPSFNYYELPQPDQNNLGKFLYFNENPLIPAVGRTPCIDPNKIKNNIQANLTKANSYVDVNNLIESNIITGKYIIKETAFKQAKKCRLPPALNAHLSDFYSYNINLLLQKIYNMTTLDNILNKIGELDIYTDLNNKIIDDKINKYYVLSKIVEELVKQQMVDYIELQTNHILLQVIKGIDNVKIDKDLILEPQEFSVSMNKSDIDFTKLVNKEYLLSSYQFSKVEEDSNDRFIIYPDEYSNSEILKSKYELIINEKIYNELLDTDTNPFILDSNGQSPIFSLLKNHVSTVIGRLKKKDLDYREFTEIKPLNFLLSELNNHTHKLTNNSKNYSDWLENFVLYQKNEVKTLILSNDKYGNNVPMYLEDSFKIIVYITNQYLSESESIPKTNELHLNNIIEELNIYENEEDNILMSIYNNKRLEISKINKNILKLSEGKIKENLEKKITEIKNEANSLLEQFVNNKKIKKNMNILQPMQILERYNKCFQSKDILTGALSAMINTNLNNSSDLKTFKIIELEKDIFKDPTYIDNNNLIKISKFYKETNNLSNIYFISSKYTDNNEVLKFIKELLEFMTVRFICYPYIMLLRKILTNYFNTIYPNDSYNDILQKVKYCLTNKILKNDSKSIKNILYTIVSKQLVLNIAQIYDNQEEEYLFVSQNTSDILDTLTNLLTINPSLSIPETSSFFTNIKQINTYFDTFIYKTISNWMVVIENVFKFNINQGRIIECIKNLILTEEENK